MMLKLSESERMFILDNIKDGQALIDEGDLNSILDPLGDWVVLNGFDENNDLTDEGRKVQRMYDSIFQNNVNQEELAHFLFPLKAEEE